MRKAIEQPGSHSPKRSRRGKLPWHQKREELARGLPAGPPPLELRDWPVATLENLVGDNMHSDHVSVSRLMRHLWRELVFYADDSGVDCPRDGMRMMAEALASRGWELSSSAIRFARSCDNGSVPHEALQVWARADSPPSCVFHDIADRIPDHGRARISANLPDTDCCRDRKVECKYDLLQYLLENREWLFPTDARSHCCFHNQHCLAHPFGF